MSTVREIAIQLGVIPIIERAFSFHPILSLTDRLWNLPVEYNFRLKTTAGQFWSQDMRIVLHPGLLNAEKQDHIATFLHELAHAMQFTVYKQRGHGASWWEMMHQLGQQPRRTHQIAACSKAAEKPHLALEDF